jgi:hypothetical protein
MGNFLNTRVTQNEVENVQRTWKKLESFYFYLMLFELFAMNMYYFGNVKNKYIHYRGKHLTVHRAHCKLVYVENALFSQNVSGVFKLYVTKFCGYRVQWK